MSQWLITLGALAGDLGSVLSIHIVARNHCNSSSRESRDTRHDIVHMYTCRHIAHTCKVRINKSLRTRGSAARLLSSCCRAHNRCCVVSAAHQSRSSWWWCGSAGWSKRRRTLRGEKAVCVYSVQRALIRLLLENSQCLSCFDSTSGVSASFGEMLLLVAMYFHSNQLSAIIDLVCSTLGMKVIFNNLFSERKCV